MTDVWSAEIREYLVGRLSTAARIGPIDNPKTTEFGDPPIRRWWILEGKHYPTLGGSLLEHWTAVANLARRLDATFSPRKCISDRADGVVDWARTLSRGSHFRREYVVDSSGLGLNEDERAALRDWAAWIQRERTEYAYSQKIPEPSESQLAFFGASDNQPTTDRMRQCAHVARRSRWPLLRDVVTESIRPLLQSEELDRLPLPVAPDKLFELLCLVRIARHFAPRPQSPATSAQ